MNFTNHDVAKISVEQESLDLQPVYQFCRELPIPNENIPFYNILDAPIDKATKLGLQTFKDKLLNLIKKTSVSFHPAFIELSLYDPQDRKGNIFYSVLFADNILAIDCYRRQMEGNLYSLVSKEKRGPIIPNRLLHQSVYYSKHFPSEKHPESKIEFEEMQDKLDIIFAGKYDASTAKFTNNIDHFNKHIENFLLDVSNKCMANIHNNQGSYYYNYACLIPLFRPAAKFKGEADAIFNGGGIFLYGNLQTPERESEFILEVQTVLTKSIFKASHSQIAFDEIETFKNIFTAMLLHQIKNKITNQITQEIGYVLKQNKLSPETKKVLLEVKRSSENIIDKFSSHLNNVGFKLSHGIVPVINLEIFKGILSRIKNEKKVKIQFLVKKPVYKDTYFKANHEIIEAIFEELIQNALAYYDYHVKKIKIAQIIIEWQENPSENTIDISVTSINTIMEEETLKYYGLSPIKDTLSTGLGGLFINSMLEQIEAKRMKGGRYFDAKNKADGFCIKISFNLISNKNDHNQD